MPEDPPDWEAREEEIPPSLQKKWDDASRRGVRGGVCRSCGAAYTEEELSCPVCETPTEFPLSATDAFFLRLTRSFWGRAALALVALCLAALFALSFFSA